MVGYSLFPSFPLGICPVQFVPEVSDYVLKDLGINVSFISILWSHGWVSGNCAAFSSEKTSRKLWNSFGTYSSKGKTFFCWLISACILVAIVDFEQIHSLLSVLPVIEEIINESSSSSKSVWVELRWASLSSSSVIVVVVLSCFFFFGNIISNLGCLHSRVPFCQSIIGFIFLSQGNPKIILCFPNSVTKNHSLQVFSCILMFRST